MTMLAAVCHVSDQPLVIEQRPMPEPGPGEVLVRIERCGICGSELHSADGPARSFPGGLVFGHEYAGRVVTLGDGVDGLREGDLVALYPAVGCGSCAACQRGNAILCPKASRLLGGYAQYACIPAEAAIALPAGLTAADGALVEPLAVSYYGAKSARFTGDERVLVLGAGSIALAAAYWAKRLGAARIVVMSRSTARADMAKAMGADAFVAYGENELREVADALGGAPDVVFECIGSPGFLGKAIDHAAPFARVVSLGLSRAADPVLPIAAGMKDLTITFPVGYSIEDFRHVAQTMLEGSIDPKHMITSVVPLANVPEKFAQLLQGHADTKVQIAP